MSVLHSSLQDELYFVLASQTKEILSSKTPTPGPTLELQHDIDKDWMLPDLFSIKETQLLHGVLNCGIKIS